MLKIKMNNQFKNLEKQIPCIHTTKLKLYHYFIIPRGSKTNTLVTVEIYQNTRVK